MPFPKNWSPFFRDMLLGSAYPLDGRNLTVALCKIHAEKHRSSGPCLKVVYFRTSHLQRLRPRESMTSNRHGAFPPRPSKSGQNHSGCIRWPETKRLRGKFQVFFRAVGYQNFVYDFCAKSMALLWPPRSRASSASSKPACSNSAFTSWNCPAPISTATIPPSYRYSTARSARAR